MNKFCIKKITISFIGVFFGVSYTFGQTITDKPNGNNLSLGGKTLYEHGYNNTGGPNLPREAVDTVMVTSVMNYFVMPDKNYNTAYYAQNNYAATNLTVSKFEWTVANGSSIAPQTPNSATTPGTSPWIKVTWGATLGATTVKVKEVPQGITAGCESAETVINVFVIARPTIGFSQVGSPLAYTASGCYTNAAVASYDFPVTVTTSSSQILVDYQLETTALSGGTPTTTTVTNAPVTSGILKLAFSNYGHYKVTITKITDRIARKCDVIGTINSGANVFTYSVLPQPETGPVYHVPNNF